MALQIRLCRYSLQVLFECLHGAATTPKLQGLGVTFLTTALATMDAVAVRPLAPLLLKALLKLIAAAAPAGPGGEGGSSSGDATPAPAAVSINSFKDAGA